MKLNIRTCGNCVMYSPDRNSKGGGVLITWRNWKIKVFENEISNLTLGRGRKVSKIDYLDET